MNIYIYIYTHRVRDPRSFHGFADLPKEKNTKNNGTTMIMIIITLITIQL